MTAAYFPAVETWYLPEVALHKALTEMARDGVEGREGVMLWLGRRVMGQAEITHLVLLRGPAVVKRPDLLIIGAAAFNNISDLALSLDVRLVGQIHSHGPGSETDLSRLDRTNGITVPYYLSVVAPDYGLHPRTQMKDCGVHVYEPGQGYRRLSPSEVSQRIQLIPDQQLPLLTVDTT